MADTIKVRVTASEVVRYDQVVEMSTEDYDRLQEAMDAGDDNEIEWLMDAYLDRTDVYDEMNFELDEAEPV